MNRLGKFLFGAFTETRANTIVENKASLNDINQIYESISPYALGTYSDDSLRKVDRKSIYTEYSIMMQDPTINASLNLLTASALGGHESRGEVVFIRPSAKIMNGGQRAKELRYIVEKEAEHLQYLINNVIFSLTKKGIGYGDSYARIYTNENKGVTHILCNELLDSPNIQAFERAGQTIGYHALEINDFEVRRMTRLTTNQMVRMKMQRTTPLPQYQIAHVMHDRLLKEDDITKIPIIPCPVGGSLLQSVAPAYRDWAKIFIALNSQQIADSVNNQFISMDLSNVPQASREKYKSNLTKSLIELRDKIKKKLETGQDIYDTNYVFLPTWGEKQVVNSLGDLTVRTQPISLELALTHLKRGVGSLGLDLSLVGWMDIITGGLGDGGVFHTSAQVANSSVLIRQAVSEPIVDICISHFAHKYKKVFNRQDLPFRIEFYSDISASATEALNNKNTRASTMQGVTLALQALKDLGADKKTSNMLLTEVMGFDDSQAEIITNGVLTKKPDDQEKNHNALDDHSNDDLEDNDDDLEEE